MSMLFYKIHLIFTFADLLQTIEIRVNMWYNIHYSGYIHDVDNIITNLMI